MIHTGDYMPARYRVVKITGFHSVVYGFLEQNNGSGISA
jgi:hypothetical protein